MKKRLALSRCLLVVVALTAFCLPTWAQDRNLRTVLFVRVKMDQQEAWKAAVKDYAALNKKAGSDQPFTVWESQTGPGEHAVVWYSAKWKDIGEDNPKLKNSAAEMAAIFSRLDIDTINLETWIDEMQPELTMPSKEIPPMVRTSRSRIMPGKMDEAKAIFREQIFPAIKKSGATSFGVAVARYGTPANEIHTYLGLSGWADLDGPFGTEKGMTPAEWKAFQAKVSTIVESTEWDMWKYEPELSYVPAAK